jgi:CRP-like cAMP-binding protein
VAEALRWGARDYIVKPFTEDVVLEKLNRLQTQIDARKCAETSHLLEAIAKSASADGKAPFLSELSPELAEELKARGVRAGFEPDVVLALPAQVFETLDVVLSGEVRVETASGGEERLGIGDCLGDESFVSGAVFGGTARASGRVELLRVSRAAVGDLVRRFPKLSVALSGRLARRSTSRRKAEEGVGFSGRLAAMPISDLVQVLHLCRKTGELRLQRDGREASVFIEDGSVRDAKSGAHQGEAAVYEILGWRDAEFTFRSGAKSGRTTIEQPTLTLLLEGARRLDEASNA